MLIHTRLKELFNENNILRENQFGYREGKNTELAGLKVISKILDALNSGKYVIAVFLDYSSCFDTLSRDKLYKMLF